jgi:hypothetical protein
MRYHSNEQECLAVVWAIRRYRHYIDDKLLLLQTDNKTTKNERAKPLRRALELQSYQFTIEHCSEKENQLPDVQRPQHHREPRRRGGSQAIPREGRRSHREGSRCAKGARQTCRVVGAEVSQLVLRGGRPPFLRPREEAVRVSLRAPTIIGLVP